MLLARHRHHPPPSATHTWRFRTCRLTPATIRKTRRLIATSAVTLTSLNGMAAQAVEVYRAVGVTVTPVWYARATVRGDHDAYTVELFMDAGNVASWCACPSRRLCAHELAAWSVATDAGQVSA
jgi:uncharacterized Zn finger protein